MTKHLAQILSLNLAVFLLIGCAGTKEEAPQEEEAAVADESINGTPFTREHDQDTCLLISHQVENFDVWRAAFDLAGPVRENYGIDVHHVYRGLNDTNLAMVYTLVENINKGKAYMTSPDLESAMEAAGVQGDISLLWLQQRLDYTLDATDTILMYMSFKVIDYDRWEKAFLKDFKKDGDNKDFQVLNVLQGIEDPGEVHMLFKVNDPNYVEKMEKNNSFRMKMLAAGVVSYPTTYKLLERPR